MSVSSPYALDHCIAWQGLTYEVMAQEIADSFKRSEAYGINRLERNKKQCRLTPDELSLRCTQQAHVLEVVERFINTFYLLLQAEDFMFAFVDKDGYILRMHGGEELLRLFGERNCALGFRWTEQDVGTSAISLCHARKMPIQVNDKDHYCKRAHRFTSSAAPILDRNCNLQGVLVTSGSSKLVHVHTLAMIMNAASAIERELYLAEVNADLQREASFLENTIEGITTGILIADADLNIVYMNKCAEMFLGGLLKKGRNLLNMGLVEKQLREAASPTADWSGRALAFVNGNKVSRVVAKVKEINTSDGGVSGFLIDFEPAEQALQSANSLTGSQAYFTFDSLIGRSAPFMSAISLAKKAAEVDSTVLIQGETGTGKELVAQAIYNAARKRKKGLFVPINCAAIPSELLESELFGYVDGAFTGGQKGGKLGKFELANHGTILLDEIGDMPLGMQSKLLRVLQTKEVYRIGASRPVKCNVKVIASTHVNLLDRVKKRLFREDLFYRLNVFPILLPSLRERGEEDIILLSQFFLHKYGQGKVLSTDAMRLLTRYKWPGNVRELENIVQRALYMADGETIDASLLPLSDAADMAWGETSGSLAAMEKQFIETTLQQCQGNMRLAAKRLGIARATLYRKKEIYGIA